MKSAVVKPNTTTGTRSHSIKKPKSPVMKSNSTGKSSSIVSDECTSQTTSSEESQSSQFEGPTPQRVPLPVKRIKMQEVYLDHSHLPKEAIIELQRKNLYFEEDISERLMKVKLNDPEAFNYIRNNVSASMKLILSKALLCDLEMRMQKPEYKEMQKHRETLPAFKERENILNIIENNQVVVLGGATGCGKTTQVPQYILDSYILAGKGFDCKIVCTQPRRISAVGVAERVAAERCVPCGENKDVGYHIRLDKKIPRDYGSILFCTTGIILIQLQSNPYLSDISHIIVDEVHERDVLSDFFLMNLRDILCKNKNLRVILMSATVNTKLFSSYFDECPVIDIPGRTFPVKTLYLEDIIQITGNVKQKMLSKSLRKRAYEKEKLLYLETIAPNYLASTIRIIRNWNEDDVNFDLIMALLKHITSDKKSKQKASEDKEGSILIFLPGMKEIQTLYQRIQNSLPDIRKFIVIPLHSLTSNKYQKQVLGATPDGFRKIILSTNIAETSITIDDCTVVIDSGKFKLKDFDPVTNIHILQPQWIALANAKQRRGRAGRTQPGVCYHLFTSFKESKLDEFPVPEIQRCNLEELILQMKILGKGDVREYFCKALNPPKPGTVEVAINVLRELNALNSEEELTPIGSMLARLPVDVHIGKMLLLSAIFSCLDPITTIAACLSFKDPFQFTVMDDDRIKQRYQKYVLSADSQSDHLLFVRIMQIWKEVEEDSDESNDFCKENFLTPGTLKMLDQLKLQYTRYLKQFKLVNSEDPSDRNSNANSGNDSLVRAILCAGLYPNIVKVYPRERSELGPLRAATKYGSTVHVHPKSINAFENFITTGWLCYYMKMKSTKVYIHDTTKVHPHCMLIFGSQVKKHYGIGGLYCLSIDNWIKCHGSHRELDRIMYLRCQFNNIFKKKILRPSLTNWYTNSDEIKVLQCVMDFIS